MSPEIVSPQFQNPAADTAAYLMLGLPLHVVLLVVGLAFAVPLALVRKYKIRSAVVIVMKAVASVFISGLFGHLYWSEYIWNVVYFSPDYVVDFWMFFPANGDIMSPAGWDSGHLISSHTESDISTRWWLVSIPCWLLAGALFTVSMSYYRNRSEQAVPPKSDRAGG